MSLLDKINNDDFIYDKIIQNLPSKKKVGKKFISINCPMCVSRGETPDKRMRCGIAKDYNGFGINCFNCKFTARWAYGQGLNNNIKEFMSLLGISDYEIKNLAFKAKQYQKILEIKSENYEEKIWTPCYPKMLLPSGSKTITEWANDNCIDNNYIDVVNYLFSRGDVIANNYEYYWCNDLINKRRLIIPFYYKKEIVGYTSRSIIPKSNKRYINYAPDNYIFNTDAILKPHRAIVIIVEGVLDAIAIDGLGLLGSSLNKDKIKWIKSFGKEVVILPDRDSSGENLIDIAIENNWSVAFPTFRDGYGSNIWWDSDVKDCAEASKRYGQLWTIMSIIKSSVNNKVKINQLRKIFY